MSVPRPIDELVDSLYASLVAGDAEALSGVLHREFVSHIAEGMPAGAGRHVGPDAARDDGWWAIGRAFAVRAVPEEVVPCADGRLLVRGRYRGRARRTDAAVDAAFMHLWTARDGRLVELHQVTDTARWDLPAPEGAPS